VEGNFGFGQPRPLFWGGGGVSQQHFPSQQPFSSPEVGTPPPGVVKKGPGPHLVHVTVLPCTGIIVSVARTGLGPLSRPARDAEHGGGLHPAGRPGAPLYRPRPAPRLPLRHRPGRGPPAPIHHPLIGAVANTSSPLRYAPLPIMHGRIIVLPRPGNRNSSNHAPSLHTGSTKANRFLAPKGALIIMHPPSGEAAVPQLCKPQPLPTEPPQCRTMGETG